MALVFVCVFGRVHVCVCVRVAETLDEKATTNTTRISCVSSAALLCSALPFRTVLWCCAMLDCSVPFCAVLYSGVYCVREISSMKYPNLF